MSSPLSAEQKARIEKNKAEAERKRKLSQEKAASQSTASAAPTKTQTSLASYFLAKPSAAAAATTTPAKAAAPPVAAAAAAAVFDETPALKRSGTAAATAAAVGAATAAKRARVIRSEDDEEAEAEAEVKVADDLVLSGGAIIGGGGGDAASRLALFECTEEGAADDGAWQELASQNAPRKKLVFGARTDDNDDSIARKVHDNVKMPDWLVRRLDRERRAPGTPGYDETTLYIPPAEFNKLSDMMKQYWTYQSQHMDEIVFLQWGTFYECLWTWADIVVRECGIAYTNRPNMNLISAGVPVSGWEKHVQTLVKRGYTVTMLSQGEKGENDKVVERSVSVKASLGTLNDEAWLPDTASGYVLALKETPLAAGDGVRFGVCLVDTSTNECRVGSFDDDAMRCRLDALLMQTNVRELLLEKQVASARTRSVVRQHVNARLVHTSVVFAAPAEAEAQLALHFGAAVAERPAHVQALDEAALAALATMLEFLRTAGTGKLDEQLLKARDVRALVDRGAEQLFVDGTALRNLCVLPPPSEPTATLGTLLGFVDRCATPFGRRLLVQWLAHPLRTVPAIEARLDAVDELLAAPAGAGDGGAAAALRALLPKLPDLERRVAALATGRLRAGEFVALVDSLQSVAERLGGDGGGGSFRAPLLRANAALCAAALGSVVARADALFDRAEAGKGAEARVVPRRGADAEFDACTDALAACKAALDAHLAEMRTALGCRTLAFWHPKGKMSNAYQLEVPDKVQVPSGWEKKSGKAGITRYHSPFITKKLPEFERLTAECDARQAAALARVQRACVTDLSALRGGVRALAELDVLQAFARAVADARVSGPMVRPRFEDEAARGGALLQCRALRHPCLSEATSAPVPNDFCLDGAPGAAQPPLALLTGANMAGKSTMLRQACLAVILAQCGCHVPALECRLTPVDAILTRIGAHDNILAGQSTFMVELLETSAALRCATPSSLVILDELGRGTSTHDGLAIAYAVIDELARRRCRALFATHYHLLSATYAARPRDVALWHMKVAIESSPGGGVGRIVPLYQLAIGAALRSFGAECALMSGVPQSVVDRAAVIARDADQIGRDRFVIDTTHALAALALADSAGDDETLAQLQTQIKHVTTAHAL